MAKKTKWVPESATSRAKGKHVRIPQAPLIGPLFPSWRFSIVDKDGPFRWPINEPIELDILQKLRAFDSMEWSKIQGSDHHAIPLESLSPDAKERLVSIGRDDIDEVVSFHFNGKSRIFGIRDGHAVKLLWWDPEHAVCPSRKKHT